MKPFTFINTLKETEPEMARREYIIRNVLFFSFIVAFSFTLISFGLYLFGKMPLDTLIIYSVVSILLAAAIFLTNAGYWHSAGIIPPLLMYFPAVNANYIGGIDAPGNFMYALLIIFVAIIYGYRKMWIALGICLVTYLCLAGMISIGYIKPYRTAEVVFASRVVLTSGFLVGIALMIWLLGRSYRTEIDVRIKAEELLSRKNEELGTLNEALQKSEERYKSLVENADEAIIVIQDGSIKYVNSRSIASFGYSEQEFLSIPIFNLVHPEDREAVTRRYLQKISGDKTPTRNTYRAFHKNGHTKWIEISSVLVDWEGRPATLNLITDISERRRTEEEKRNLEERLQRAQKMEALGQLAGGVAHDLNNVMGIMTGYSELLLMDIPEGQRARSHAEKILQSTEKGAAIIQDLLTLARRGVTVSEVIDLNHIVSGFLKTPMFEMIKDYHSRVNFRAELQEELLSIKGSPVHLEKSLMNLVTNAAESITGLGEVTIRTQSRYLDKAVLGYDEVREGDYTILSISDTGMGIPAEHREKIFEPFYTKKAMGRSGTGLGLAIVWGTVKDHSGYIDVQSEGGAGTTFTLYFPATREELTTPKKKTPIEQYVGNGESILVVDDIAEQRDVASGLLTRLGYRVHAVSSGEEALDYLRRNKADILVLDMIMTPGIDGLETYQRVLEINPRQKAILVSGFSETDRVTGAQALGAGAYVKKPYMMENIGLAIRNELHR
jgi:PAS domain S-box-containing protein